MCGVQMNTNIVDLLKEAAIFSSDNPNKPGVVIERLLKNPKYKDLILNLKSDDLKDIRIK